MEKQWRPKIDEEYYYIDDEGIVDSCENMGDEIDKHFIKIGNCFKTEKEVKFELEKINFLAEMKEDFEPWKCDWKNSDNDRKHCLEYSFSKNKIETNYVYGAKIQGVIYTNTWITADEYANNPDTAKYLFGIKPEPIEKKYIIELNTNSGILYIDCNREEVIKELKFTNKKENATIFGNDDANYVSAFYLALKKVDVENEEEKIKIEDKNE